MNHDPRETPADDDYIAALLRRKGARLDPPAAAMEEIRRAVHAEWQAVTSGRRLRRRRIGFAIAAGVATVMLALGLTLRSVPPSAPVAAAVVERVDGSLQLELSSSQAAPMQAGRPIMTGETVTTDARSKAALRVAGKISVRLDTDTTLAVLAPDRLELRAGAVYVDSGPIEAGYTPLELVTAAGHVRHVGTQYQVRTHADNVTISVREGRVELTRDRGNAMASAGEQLIASARGELARSTLSSADARWAWATQIAPPFDIEDRPLTEFLAWVARETGHTLVYATPAAEAAARELRLRGSIANLTPTAALTAVLATTQFEQADAEQNVLRISLRD